MNALRYIWRNLALLFLLIATGSGIGLAVIADQKFSAPSERTFVPISAKLIADRPADT